MFRQIAEYFLALWHFFVPSEGLRRAQRRQAELRAAEILRCLQNGEWESLRAYFFGPLRLFLSAAFLERGWKAITASTGALKLADDPVVVMGWFGPTAKVPLQFRRSIRLTMSLQMTPSGHLYGLRLEPPAPLPWNRPLYAGLNVTATKLTLGRGLSRVEGLLTSPVNSSKANPAPCVILIGGSGPVDKDSNVGALKPFKDLALGLSSIGIAVCRFDKPTCTLLGKLRLGKSRITLTDEYVYHTMDAIKQMQQRPEIDATRITLLGHSLGGLIAARLSSTDDRVAGCILMATPAEPMYRCAIRQLRYMASLENEDTSVMESATNTTDSNDHETLTSLVNQAQVADDPSLSLLTPASQLPFGIGPAYWLEYRDFDPLSSLAFNEKRVLVLQGTRDYQVTVEHDYNVFKRRFEDRENFTFHKIDGLNHLFAMGAGRPTPSEYDMPGNVDPRVIGYIQDWVQRLPKAGRT